MVAHDTREMGAERVNLPIAVNGCRCICHRRAGVKHFFACCGISSPMKKVKEVANFPTAPGYYWAKLKTPSGGTLYGPNFPPDGVRFECDTEDWCSLDWEIVEVNQNAVEWSDRSDPEYFSVNVFGVPVTQWPLDFFWGPKINLEKPK